MVAPSPAPARSPAPAAARAGRSSRTTGAGRAFTNDAIVVLRARQHNLHVDELVIPKNAFVVFTGPSGSGKSSLAFDTLYAEGQRRYIETLSAYARQFLGQLDRPDVHKIKGLTPTVAIEQKTSSSNPRSTVGTITEIHDYLRVLYARGGEQHCVDCGKRVGGRSAGSVADELAALPEGTKVRVLARLVEHRKGELKGLFEELASRGFARVEVDGETHPVGEVPPLAKHEKHTVDLVIDRIVVRDGERQRLLEAVESALREGKGELLVASEAPEPKGAKAATQAKPAPPTRYSTERSCCGRSYPELVPASFSFNGPLGMCPDCQGLGIRLTADPSLVVVDDTLSIRDGAVAPWASAMQRGEGWIFRIVTAAAKTCGAGLDTPWKKLPAPVKKKLLHGIGGEKIKVAWGNADSGSHGVFAAKFEGILPQVERLYRDTSSEQAREGWKKYMRERPCGACEGRRLRPESLAVFVAGKSIDAVGHLPIRAAAEHFAKMTLTPTQATILEGPLGEIRSRLTFLLDVGLEYLTLDRSGPTLSGGEAQRIRLASQLGSELAGVTYVLDEPSIGLHPRDTSRLVATLRHLRDLGNTVLVVEHDEDTILAADHVVDFGPGAGRLGGRVVAEGTPEQLAKNPKSPTGAYLSGRARIERPATRRTPRGQVTVVKATENNLKNVTVSIPVGCFTAVTGVSGAGKSSLVGRVLLPALGQHLHGSLEPVGAHARIDGLDQIDRVVSIDQRPIGRTPRSNPGTYTKCFDLVREVFANLPDARARGWNAGRFSFNVKGGRCEPCSGDGTVKVEMHFLADVYVRCEACQGKRYDASTLDVKFRGKSIHDVLEASIDDCAELFVNIPPLARMLRMLQEVGLGYVALGQPATTLSGGEAQRVKLARELGKSQSAKTLYVLDEPTTGLHFDDVKRLLGVLDRLVDNGSTVVVVEHNLDVMGHADHLVDLGPEGGDRGGELVATGTPEEVAKVKRSLTGQHLAPWLAARAEKAKRARA